MHPVASQLVTTVKRWDLWKKDAKVLVAVSGGVDSVGLLHLLLHLPKPIRPRIIVAHYDHHLRNDSHEDAELVRRVCDDWDVPCFIGESEPKVWKDKKNIEAKARELRYSYLFRVATEEKVSVILTAHHAQDQLETFFLRLLQGSGLNGLAGIRLKSEREGFTLLRPLLFTEKKDILNYAKESSIPYRDDSTNAERYFLRNRLRHWLLPLIQENKDLASKLSQNLIFLQADEAYLSQQTEKWIEEKVQASGKGFQIKYNDWKDLPSSLQYRILKRLLEELSIPRIGNRGKQILDLCLGLQEFHGKKTFIFPGKVKVLLEKSVISLKKT